LSGIETHDCFTSTEYMAIDHFGITAPGQSWQAIENGDIEIDVRQGRAYLEITANNDSNLKLISNPETVEALQELTRLAVQVKTNSFSRLILDVGGSRQTRVDDLTRIVNKLVAKVKDTGEAIPMKPMSSYERKIVHDLVSEAGLVSESEGEGKERHIVIKPA
jgi:spoIIIJ-associated protein